MKLNKVSVIMSIFNETEDEIKKSISSIVNQTYSYLEIIIILDNPKRNDITEIIEKLNTNKNIMLFINEENLGLAQSLNKAFNLSTGNFIARMDSDDISFPERIEKQMSYLLNDSSIDLVTTSYNLIDEKGNFVKKGAEFNYESNKLDRLLHIQNFLIHPSWLMRKNVFVELNGYRNFPSSQDYDFILRLLDRGGKIEILPEILLNYRVRVNSISNSRGLEQFMLSNYIKKLSKERKKKYQDSFSEEKMNLHTDVSDIEKIKFNIAKEKFNNNKISICYSVIYSRIFRKYISEKIKFKLVEIFF